MCHWVNDPIMTRFMCRRTIKSLKREWRISLRRPVAIIFCAIGVGFFFFSLPFLGIAYLFYASSVSSMRGTIQTNGTIVTTCNGDTSTTCHPIVSFRTQSGKKIQFASNFSSSSMPQGDIVPVNYHPKDPQDAVISSFTSLWLFPVLLGGIGGFLLLVAIVLFILALVFAFGKRSRAPSTFVDLSVPTVPSVPSASEDLTTPSASITPTVPSVSMAPTVPLAPTYPYHDPGSYNPYR
jgi:Protein of unknown function (DUF3592)